MANACVKVLFQAFLLGVSRAAASSETHLADTQRHMRMETEHEPHKTSAVELSPTGAQVSHTISEPRVRENFKLADSHKAFSYYDVDDTHVLTKEQWTKFQAPSYPCEWNVQISRADKGPKAVWRTIQVKGTSSDTFHFRGCSTEGEEAFVCQHVEGAQGGVRLMRNVKGEVVGFGSCCKANQVDAVIASRMGQCDASWQPPLREGLEVNGTSWMRSAQDAVPMNEPANWTLRLTIFIGSILLVIISYITYNRFKK